MDFPHHKMPFRNGFRQLKVGVLRFFGSNFRQKVGAKIDDGDVPLISSTNMAVPPLLKV